MGHNFDVSANEYQLNDPPSDLIQSIKFGQYDSRHLLVASWDTSVRLYDINANQMKASYNHASPVLDCTFEGTNYAWSGGADCTLKRFDFKAQVGMVVGKHDDAIKAVEYCQDVNLVATGSWDGHLKIWDPRLCDAERCLPTNDTNLKAKIYSIGACGDKLIVGCSDRKIYIYDLRNMTYSQRETSLKYQIRCVKPFADQQGYVVGSIEGRVAVEYIDPSPEVQKQKYAFKCHRNKDSSGAELVYPVNSISFHRKFNTFATGGSDGYVGIWDGRNKKRLVQFHKYPTSISSLCFSQDGSILAIASSYLGSSEEANNERDFPPDRIYIRRISEHEVRNKS